MNRVVNVFSLMPIIVLLLFSILKKLESCVDGGKKCTAPEWLRKLKKEWWDKMVPCFLHASSCGSLDVVKYFIDSGQKPNIRYTEQCLHHNRVLFYICC